MRNLIILVLLFLSVSVNAQQREQRGQKCIKTTVVEKQGKVHVITNNSCTKKKSTKVYTKEQWNKILEERRKKRRRGGN
tara:strand:- start:512 stop:748 length:237 start_codon:yes stop_codon:yes gene_type:complete